MSLLSKFRHLMPGGTSPEHELEAQLSSLRKDGRMHVRVQLSDADLGTLSLVQAGSGQIINLSFGGVAALFAPNSAPVGGDEPLLARLRLLDRSLDCKVKQVRTQEVAGSHKLVAFTIMHDQPQSLLFLREFIDPARQGASLIELPIEVRKAPYNSPEWHCYRGDGPCDLVIHQPQGELEPKALLLTFPLGEKYCEVAYRDGRLSTGQTSGTSGAQDPGTAAMRSFAELDNKIVRAATALLSASSSNCRALVAPVLAQLKSRLYST